MGRGLDGSREDIHQIAISGMFDVEGYLQRYPDVAAAGLNPVEHYVKHGAKEGRIPCDGFDPVAYLHRNPDVAVTGMDPFRHYVQFGHKEGRQPNLDPNDTYVLTRGENPRVVIGSSGLFDADFYISTYGDVRRAGVDPLQHYLDSGAAEGRQPNAFFAPEFYCSRNANAAGRGVMPLVNYIEGEWRKLFDTHPSFPAARYWLACMAPDGLDSDPLADFLARRRAHGADWRPWSKVTREGLQDAATRVLQRHTSSAGLYKLLGASLSRTGAWSVAEEALQKASRLGPGDADTYLQLSVAQKAQGKALLATESLEQALALGGPNAKWHALEGECYSELGQYDRAAIAYRAAWENSPDNSVYLYRLGCVLQQAGRAEEADQILHSCVAADKDPNVAKYGLGVLHQRHGQWADAARAYARRAAEFPTQDGELYYRLGMALDRCYRWGDALEAYDIAVVLNPSHHYWHYRRAFVLERMGLLADAAAGYGRSAGSDPKDGRRRYSRYRQGYVLAGLGEFEQACSAYLETRSPMEHWSAPTAVGAEGEELALAYRRFDEEVVVAVIEKMQLRHYAGTGVDLTDPFLHFQWAQLCDRNRRYAEAAIAYQGALDRSGEHRPEWFYRLGHALYRCSKFEEAANAFREVRIPRRPFGVDTASYEKNPAVKMTMAYIEYMETLSVRPKVVLYESFAGTSFGCNPRAIMDAMLDRPDDGEWTHVVVLNRPETLPAEYRRKANVVVAARDSDLYLRYLATASHLVNNSTFPTYFIRRPEQKYLNTWHGTPLKTLGRDMKGRFLEHKNFSRNLLQATHLISGNKHTTQVLMNSHEVSNTYSGTVAETGYPRVDVTLRTANAPQELKGRLDIDPSDTVILYAPTWRGKHGELDANESMVAHILQALAAPGRHILFRAHSLVESLLNLPPGVATIVPEDVDSNALLGVVDILVTDYSSIVFDYIPLCRPIIYFAYDQEQYEEERGLYFSLEDLPGVTCRDPDAVVSTVNSILNARDRHLPSSLAGMQEAISVFCPVEDGGSSRRAIEYFVNDVETSVVSVGAKAQNSLLIYAGAFPPNGITSSCLNLVEALIRDGNAVTVAIDPHAINAFPERAERFGKLPSGCQIIGRVGQMCMTPEERWLMRTYDRTSTLSADEMWGIVRRAHEREYMRCFGYGRFDALVQFEGYSRFWSGIFASGKPDARRVIYLHNDMQSEWNQKYPFLRGVFHWYPNYDALISVSQTMRDVNRDHLMEKFDLDPGVFAFCENTIDATEIVERSKEPLASETKKWLGGRRFFFSMGRLSHEKDQKKLILAFAKIHASFPDIALVIYGDGPLRGVLHDLVDSLGLQDSVLLSGVVENPFPALNESLAFVLSSNHEGQPMVLLEAMALGRPIIATDIHGNRGAISKGYGELVENSVDGLGAAMDRVAAGDVHIGKFDADAYRRGAITMFYEKLGSRWVATAADHARGLQPASRHSV